MTEAAQDRVVVVGAALGTGRWFADHLEGTGPLLLLDTAASAGALKDRDDGRTVVATTGAGAVTRLADGGAVDLGSTAAVVVAVPPAALDGVLSDLARRLPSAAEVVVVTSTMTRALAAAAVALPGRRVVGVHLLFDPGLTPVDGQGVFVVADGEVPGWLATLVTGAGGVLRTGTAAQHDAAMAVVQATTHRALVAFADAVTRSDVDLETLWTLRTPLFDSLLGLTTRALDPRQQAQVAAVQEVSGDAAGERLAAALADLGAERVELALERVRERITGSLFEELSASARAAIQAAQGRRRDIARRWRDGRLVGLRRVGTSGPVRVGRIAAVTPSRVELDVLLVGEPGRAALLDGPGLANAARLGVPRLVRRQGFGLGHIELVTEPELAAVLDEHLAFLGRDVRFLVPESVSGAGVARVVARSAGLRDVRLVDEVVRTGQRSVVVHLGIRADRDVAATVEAVRQDVEAAYSWPDGVAETRAHEVDGIAYLGPAGTFSEAAAKQCAIAIGAPTAALTAYRSFGEVLAALGPGTVAVLPISSSSSGLVPRAVDALLAHDGAVEANGMVDVAVRFDAYASHGGPLESYRGAPVYSHPQGLAQCTGFIARWGLDPRPADSTAEAMGRALASAEPAIALGGAGLGGPTVVEREVDDLSGSITRFLVLGAPGAFTPATDGSDPTVRSVWIGGDVAAVPALLPGGAAGFSELLTDEAGRFLLISSRRGQEEAPAGVRALGTLPWSPRTPVVRVAAD